MTTTRKAFTVTDFPVGENVSVSIDGSTATFAVDLDGNLGATASASNTMVAKTIGGAVDLPGKPGYKVQVTVYRAPTDAEKAEYAPAKANAKAIAAAARAAARAA